jgi:hypothetical protein
VSSIFELFFFLAYVQFEATLLASQNKSTLTYYGRKIMFDSEDGFINKNTSADYESNKSEDKHNPDSTKVRKRIDELMEKKRLRDLLDDSDDW